MGSAGAKLSKTEEQLVDQKKYVREPIIPYDVRYGEKVRIYKQVNSTQRVAIIQKIFDTQLLYQATLDIQKVLAKLRHPGLIQLLNIVTKKKEQLCSQFYKVKFLYEYVDNDLQRDLELRRQLENDLKTIPAQYLTSLEDLKINNHEYKIHYEESELWYIIATSIAVLSYLKERNLIHGDIRPFNLCLTSDNILKVMTINSLIQTNWSSYMEKLEKLDTTSTYVSPIQLGALQHNIQRPIHNVPKSDIFCLGVIILELCLLESAQDIYDFTTYSIDLSLRIKKIREMKRYSDNFIDFLISMLNLSEEKRKNPEELYQTLSELAKQQEISISNRIFSLERVLLIVNKWKQKNQLNVNFNANFNQQQGGDKVNNQQQNVGMTIQQQQGFVLPDQIFQPAQQIENNQTEDELPNQEEGEIIQELGLISKNDNKENNSNSFSIQKSANNISPSKRHSEDQNKNNISIQSGHNESLNKIKKDLSGEFKLVDKENLFFGKGGQQDNFQCVLQRNMSQNQIQNILTGNTSNTNLFDQNNQSNNIQQQGGYQRSLSQYSQNQQNNQNQNKLTMGVSSNNLFGPPQQPQQQQQQQFGQSQFSNNYNMFQGSTGTFGGGNFNQQNQLNNNSLFGMQNNNQNNNNINNQFQQTNNNPNIGNNNVQQNLLLIQQLLAQKNGGNVNNQQMMSDPQVALLFAQLQQNLQFQQQQQGIQFNSNNNNNNIQQQIPPLDLNAYGKGGNMYNTNSQQMNMSPTFNNQQNINFQMNRAGGYNHVHSNSNVNQNNSFYNNNNTGGYNNNNMAGFNNNNVGGYNSNPQFSNNNLNQQTNQFSTLLQSNNQSAAQSQLNLFNPQNNFNGGTNLANNNSNLFLQNNGNPSSNTNLYGQNNNVNVNQNVNAFGKMNSLTGGGGGANISYSQNGNTVNNNTNIQLQAGGQQSQANLFGRSNTNNRSIF